MSSISQADGIYWQNEKELPAYYRALDEARLPIAKGYVLTEEDPRRRCLIMHLMCDLGLDFDAMSQRLGVDFEEHFGRKLDSLAGIRPLTPLVGSVVGTARDSTHYGSTAAQHRCHRSE
jgi:oxygen-independent coproporphyrinogen-3 oxidase